MCLPGHPSAQVCSVLDSKGVEMGVNEFGNHATARASRVSLEPVPFGSIGTAVSSTHTAGRS